MNQIPTEMAKVYDPSLVEGRIYKYWMEGGYFQPKIDDSKEPFVIIMPPPNVTGQLHLGHALQATLADIMVRWHRMKGDPTLWLPGADHAGIATQVMVERNLIEEGITKQELGRDKFLRRVWDWVERYGTTIDDQHKRLGASCDWTRRAFTLDEGPSIAVRETFSRLYQKGLIYRGERIINWCPRCSTALSDLEVDHQEEESFLYYINYGLEDSSDYLTVATTRPETLLGDTGLAVNPKDDRYRDLIGKNVLIPIINKPIPIISDEAVDLEFGTGALKITPGHDPVDFEIGQRHGLPSVIVIDLDGTMNAKAGPYSSLDRTACRAAIVKDLEESGLLSGMEPYVHSVGHCGRCSVSVEPIVSKQWFVDTGELSPSAIKVVKEGRIKIIPERFGRVYLNWMENIRDWCISRQLWWGHRIPAWYCLDCSEDFIEILFRKEYISDGLIGGTLKELRNTGMSWEQIESMSSHIFVDLEANPMVSTSSPSSCNSCGSSNLFQDPDVLDTWFSSALWPHSTLGWPCQTEDLNYFYPTSVMETAYDILLFWVARMIMMGLENTGEIPFRHVYLSGLIRDQDGAKMSKTKGNATDPIEAIDKFGTDALRFTLTTGNAPGNDLRLNESKLGASRNFVNKIWNASRYVMSNIDGESSVKNWGNPLIVNRQDRWITSRLNGLIHRVDRLMEDFLFGEAQKEIYDFFWNEYCDWYIEMVKLRIKNRDTDSPMPVLVNVLEKTLRLMHPFIPFVTEEIWQSLMWKIDSDHTDSDSLMVSQYPIFEEERIQRQSEIEIDVVMDIVRAIRNVRAEFKIDPNKQLGSVIQTVEFSQSLKEEKDVIKTLSRCGSLNFVEEEKDMPSKDNAVSAILKGVTVLVSLEGLVDKNQERVRLQQELEDCSKNLGHLENRLRNKDFIDKAPDAVVQRERERMEALLERKERIQDFINLLV